MNMENVTTSFTMLDFSRGVWIGSSDFSAPDPTWQHIEIPVQGEIVEYLGDDDNPENGWVLTTEHVYYVRDVYTNPTVQVVE
jgi:hypothetical protein